MTELAIRGDESVELIPGASETALALPDDLTEVEWRSVGEKLARANRASAWWIGDWINFGAVKWGEKFVEAQQITGLSYSYLQDCAGLSRRFQMCDRSHLLSWTHYYRVRALPDAEKLLEQAEAENWSVRELVAGSKSERSETKRQPKAYYGKGDKFEESIEPLRRYLKGWESRDFEFKHVPPKEARKRLAVLNQIAEGLAATINDLERRSEDARVSL